MKAKCDRRAPALGHGDWMQCKTQSRAAVLLAASWTSLFVAFCSPGAVSPM